MKTFTNCAEKKAKQILNLLQGYTKGIRMTAILVLLLMGVSNAWGKTIYLYTNGIGWPDSSAKIWVHAWGSGQDTDKQMTKVKDQLYKADIPDADTKVIFTRTESTSTGVWDKEWNRVGEQSLNDETPCLKLTSWTGGTWGKISYDAHMYLDNSVANWSEATKEFMIGHSSYSNTYTMTNISNTKLYYLAFSDIWHGYWDYGFIGVNSHWGEWNNKDITTRIKEATKRTGTRGDQVLNGTKLFVPANANNDANLTKTDLFGYSALNYTQTIKSAVKLAGQNYAEANSKATITVTSYNLTGNGVISSQKSASISTSAKSTTISAARTATTTLTVGTATGYQFDGWYTAATGGTKLSTSTTYTYYPTAATTVYARFSEITYSVQVKSADNNQGTVSPTSVNAGQFTGVTITATPKIGYAFKNWTATDGITIDNANSANTTIKATKAGTVTANFEAQPATTIYLEPTGHWNSDKAVFQAHVWETGKTGVNLDMEGIGDPSHADGDNKSPHRYYKVEVPYGYDKILFFRKDNFATANENAWNKTGNLTIPTDDKVLYTITSTGKGKAESYNPAATGVWKEANLVYTITLGYCEFGTYSIKYNGQSYFSKPDEDVTIDVPAGAQIEILEGQPFSNAYTGDVIKAKPTKEELTIGEPLTVNGDIMLDDNFVTKKSHVVYLGVPETLDNWQLENTQTYYIWKSDSKEPSSMTAADEGSYVFTKDNIKYYRFTIAAGCNSYRFERKNKDSFTGTTYACSEWLNFQIPLTEVNCYTLTNANSGTWGVLPAQSGDYRLLYIEQKVELENGHPKTTVTKAHPSDIIRQGDTRTIYSLHIYNKVENGENGMNDPEILVQRWDGSNWITTERHMVFGPLHADFGMAAMPGRRNAAGDPDAVMRYDNGIENIKNDTHADNGSGVWNFIVTREDNNFTGLNLTLTARYEGDYYVRTDCADGGWDRYTLNGNHMTRSDISKRNSNYSHYFCKWIGEAGVNVKYTIANDYGMAISDTLTADETDIWGTPIADAQKIVTGETLPTNNEYGGANIRFSWNEKSNFLHRAYLAGSTDVSSRFLVLEGQSGQLYDAEGQALALGANGSDRYGLKANEEIFTDISNWVYYADVQLVPNAGLKLTAKYMDKVQYFIGKADTYSNTILQGTGTQKYLIRLLYDFKINELVSAYVPGGNNNIEPIQTNLMLIREGNNDASQLNFNTNDMKEEGQTAYGVIEFPYELLNGSGDIYQRSLYWISFPFDVNLQDAFGVGQYGVHWLIQEYDGARRAEEGLWAESDSFWKLHWDQNITLKAGFGYVIELDISKICTDFEATFNEAGDCIAIYFPSAQPISGDIVKYPENNDVSVTIPAHKCTIPIRNSPYGNRQIRDSHWNVIGVPSYVNAGANFSNSVEARPEERKLKFYYKWNTYDNYEVVDANANNMYNDKFKSMFAYMVQYAGDLKWKSIVNDNTPQGLAARQNADYTTQEHNLRLELQQKGTELDRTFITMQEDDVTAAFDFNYDLCKVNNGGANIYSLIATDTYPIQVAGNVMPVVNTTIPVGVVIAAAGEYTFAMPDGTDGIVVELIDYEANTATNLLFNDYTVSLPKGTFDNRFALSVKPDKTATSLENIFNEATGDEVKKFIIDGVLYMQKDGVLYDAQGHIVR